jgi:hypothetical protein
LAGPNTPGQIGINLGQLKQLPLQGRLEGPE